MWYDVSPSPRATRGEGNISDSEISKFDAMASRWWDPDGEFKSLHAINPLRVSFITSRTNVAGKKVLDVGCGGGILTHSLAEKGADVMGIDMSIPALAAARAHNPHIDYRLITVENLAVQQAVGFDVITCFELLEHVPNPQSVVHACSQLLNPGGHIFFSTLNRTPKAYLLAIIGAEYVLKLLPKGMHAFSKFIRPSELDGWARAAGLHTKSFAGIRYNPFCKRYSLTTSVDVNYLVHLAKE